MHLPLFLLAVFAACLSTTFALPSPEPAAAGVQPALEKRQTLMQPPQQGPNDPRLPFVQCFATCVLKEVLQNSHYTKLYATSKLHRGSVHKNCGDDCRDQWPIGYKLLSFDLKELYRRQRGLQDVPGEIIGRLEALLSQVDFTQFGIATWAAVALVATALWEVLSSLTNFA